MADSNLNLNYTTVQEYTNFMGQRFVNMISSSTPNAESADTDKIERALLFAESEVDMYLKKGGYDVPIDHNDYPRSVNLLRFYTYTIATYNLYSKDQMTQPEFIAYNEVRKKLISLKDGDLILPDDDSWENLRKLYVGSTFENQVLYNSHI